MYFFLCWHRNADSGFLLIFEKVFLCYFPVKLCISFLKVRYESKFPIYRHLRRYLEGVGGRGRAIATYMVQTNFFSEKKKKIKIADFVKYCVMELTYIVMIVGGYSFLCSFCCQKKEKREKKLCADVCKSSQKSYKKSSLFIYFVFCFATECHIIWFLPLFRLVERL